MSRMIPGVALSLLVPLALTAGSATLQAQEAMAEHCTASFSQAAIPVQSEPVMVTASLSQEIGNVESGMASEESGIVVKEVKAADEGLVLSLDTSKAVAGEWKIGFKGSEGACGGKVKVEAAKQMEKQQMEKQEKKAPESGEG